MFLFFSLFPSSHDFLIFSRRRQDAQADARDRDDGREDRHSAPRQGRLHHDVHLHARRVPRRVHPVHR